MTEGGKVFKFQRFQWLQRIIDHASGHTRLLRCGSSCSANRWSGIVFIKIRRCFIDEFRALSGLHLVSVALLQMRQQHILLVECRTAVSAFILLVAERMNKLMLSHRVRSAEVFVAVRTRVRFGAKMAAHVARSIVLARKCLLTVLARIATMANHTMVFVRRKSQVCFIASHFDALEFLVVIDRFVRDVLDLRFTHRRHGMRHICARLRLARLRPIGRRFGRGGCRRLLRVVSLGRDQNRRGGREGLTHGRQALILHFRGRAQIA